MINRIKNKIKQFENSILTSQQINEDHLALTQLLKMFPEQTFLPLTSWSVSPREVLHICNEIIINKRKSIIEFGAGFSTICIAQLLKVNSINATFITIEDNSDWAEDMSDLLARLNLQPYAKVIVAPITDVLDEIAKKGQTKWYDTSIIAHHVQDIPLFDLVIVDGPFGGTTPYARYSAIPFLNTKLATEYAIFLDDSSRSDEKQTALDWQKILKARLSEYNNRYVRLCNKINFDVNPYTVRTKN